ncbi:MAG: glycosyltransferase family 4 protein [Nitrospira sp.]|nr:glycosyltransferase family 4 protein [Nitrospira sp.]
MFSIHGLHHGGAERVIAALCSHLDKKRFSVTVCWREARGAIGEELVAQGYEVLGLPEIERNVSPYRRFLTLKRLLQSKQIDVLHTHDTGALADAAQCRLMGAKAKIVHTFHFGNYRILRKKYVWMERCFSRMAHCLVAVGFEQAKQIQQALCLSSERLRVIHNGVVEPIYDETVDPLLQYRQQSNHPVIIGSISTLIEQKGLPVLLEAVAILRQHKIPCVCVIAGDGPLRPMLEAKSRQLHLTDVVYFLGWVSNAANNILPYLDIFCQSSLWEANSIVLLEAMAVGLPIVTTEVGESRHVIANGQSGLIVKPRDPKALADALMLLIQQKELRERIRRNARQTFLEKFTIDKMITHYQNVYEGLMQ